jgi:hypothetical protein
VPFFPVKHLLPPCKACEARLKRLLNGYPSVVISHSKAKRSLIKAFIEQMLVRIGFVGVFAPPQFVRSRHLLTLLNLREQVNDFRAMRQPSHRSCPVFLCQYALRHA